MTEMNSGSEGFSSGSEAMLEMMMVTTSSSGCCSNPPGSFR